MSEVIGKFTPQQAAELAGLPYTTLDFWNQSGFIKPGVTGSQGRGKLRYYSFQDLIALRIARELRGSGISLQRLRQVIAKLRNEHGFTNPMAEAWLVTDGHDVCLVDGAGVVSVLKRPGQRFLFHVIDFAGAVREVEQKVEALKAA